MLQYQWFVIIRYERNRIEHGLHRTRHLDKMSTCENRRLRICILKYPPADAIGLRYEQNAIRIIRRRRFTFVQKNLRKGAEINIIN